MSHVCATVFTVVFQALYSEQFLFIHHPIHSVELWKACFEREAVHLLYALPNSEIHDEFQQYHMQHGNGCRIVRTVLLFYEKHKTLTPPKSKPLNRMTSNLA